MSQSSETSILYEGMTSISALLENPESAARIERILIDETKVDKKAKEIAFLEAKAKEFLFPLEYVKPIEIEGLALGKTHGGILAFCRAKEYSRLTPDSILPNGFYAYLDGIEDPYNFGYTLRAL